MPWNEPGSGPDRDRSPERPETRPGDQDRPNEPWGQSRGNQQPPDLDEVVRNIQTRLGGIFGGGNNRGSGNSGSGGPSFSPGFSRFGLGGLLLVGALLWGATGFYVVEQSEQGVELMFGRYSETKDAGLRWHFPYPIETVEIVDTQRIHTVEVGYRQSDRSSRSANKPDEALMLTKDENIIDIQFAVQYNIKDARNLLFHVAEAPRNVDSVVRQATESAVREIVGTSTMDFVITEGRSDVASRTRDLLQVILDRYTAGINVVAVEMQNAQPPEQVKDAFDDVVSAREDEVRFTDEARAYANDVIPRARGQAARVLQEADAYRATVVAKAQGEANRFGKVLEEYTKAPGITRDRLYLDSMEQVLSRSSKLMIDQKGGNNMIYLPLDQLMRQQRQGNSQSSNVGSSLPSRPTVDATDNTANNGRPGRGSGRSSRVQ